MPVAECPYGVFQNPGAIEAALKSREQPAVLVPTSTGAEFVNSNASPSCNAGNLGDLSEIIRMPRCLIDFSS